MLRLFMPSHIIEKMLRISKILCMYVNVITPYNITFFHCKIIFICKKKYENFLDNFFFAKDQDTLIDLEQSFMYII